jgi:hypothetical protein
MSIYSGGFFMSKYQCPLCKQEVSKALYEKITGIWQEKERQMANLKKLGVRSIFLA